MNDKYTNNEILKEIIEDIKSKLKLPIIDYELLYNCVLEELNELYIIYKENIYYRFEMNNLKNSLLLKIFRRNKYKKELENINKKINKLNERYNEIIKVIDAKLKKCKNKIL